MANSPSAQACSAGYQGDFDVSPLQRLEFSHRKYLTQTLIRVGVAVINPNAENFRIYKSSFLADRVQQIWLSVAISFQ